MNQELLKLAQKYCAGKAHSTPADVLAVIERESGGVATFSGQEALYRGNLNAAAKITGMTLSEIVTAMRIGYGPMKGQIAKFRVEPGYFAWAAKLPGRLTPVDRLLLSCSFGVGQKMTRWLVSGSRRDDWTQTIRQFMGSLATQVMYVAGDLEYLLARSPDNRPLAYTRYNAGAGAQHVTEYGEDVKRRYDRILTELDASN